MVYTLCVRESMMIAHSFKGEEFGPAQNVLPRRVCSSLRSILPDESVH
jgi:hypothetical protein